MVEGEIELLKRETELLKRQIEHYKEDVVLAHNWLVEVRDKAQELIDHYDRLIKKYIDDGVTSEPLR